MLWKLLVYLGERSPCVYLLLLCRGSFDWLKYILLIEPVGILIPVYIHEIE